MQKAPISRLHSSVQNQPTEQIKDAREPGGKRLNSKPQNMQLVPNDHSLVSKPSPICTVAGMQKAPISRLHSSVQNQPNGQIKDVREPGGERLNSKVPVVGLNSKPQSKLPPEGTSSNPPQHLDRQKKRPFSSLDDEHDYFAEIRKILSGPYKPFSNDDIESGDELGEIDEETEAKMVEDEIARNIEEMRQQRLKRSS